MAIPKGLAVTETRRETFLDRNGQFVEGYRVFFEIEEFNEIHDVTARTLSEGDLNPILEKFLSERRALQDTQ